MRFPASCFCGAVQFKLMAKPMFINCCHCRDCQIQTGGAFAINGLIEAEYVRLTKGKPVRVTMPTESGLPHDIYRCAKCQTALWSDYSRRKVILFVRMTTLKDARRFPPDVHIFARSALPCDPAAVALKRGAASGRVPRIGPKGATTGRKAGVYKVYYDIEKEYPAASLKRREACLAKMKK